MFLEPTRVSIHAPAGGATLYVFGTWRVRLSFNSRARRGRDRLRTILGREKVFVSIHAPAGGATGCFILRFITLPVSIHAPAGGATKYASAPSKARQFQFTRPQGARLRQGLRQRTNIRVSIHAPAGGATNPPTRPAVWLLVSIHAPAGGAT